MKSIFGLTNLQAKFFYGPISRVEHSVNEFLKAHDGDIVDVTPIGASDPDLIKVSVLYRISEEAQA